MKSYTTTRRLVQSHFGHELSEYAPRLGKDVSTSYLRVIGFLVVSVDGWSVATSREIPLPPPDQLCKLFIFICLPCWVFCKIVILNGLWVNSSPDWGYGLNVKSPGFPGLSYL